MKPKTTLAVLFVSATLPANAQMFSFSLRTNNQQVIDEALSGAFVRISQSYELRDTVNGQSFGRGGKDYFSIVPFLGVETERGLVFPTAALSPWTCDKDFEEHEGKYKPSVTATEMTRPGRAGGLKRSAADLARGTKLTRHLSCLGDSAQISDGLRPDTVPGKKKGWMVWITPAPDGTGSDSVRYNSVPREMEVPADGKPLPVEKPDVTGTVYGGIYVSPVQTGIGQITFTLSGVIVPDGEGWVLDFPFVGQERKPEALTPIGGTKEEGNDGTHKKKGKRK